MRKWSKDVSVLYFHTGCGQRVRLEARLFLAYEDVFFDGDELREDLASLRMTPSRHYVKMETGQTSSCIGLSCHCLISLFVTR